jgi:hypothetical protein
VTDVPTIRAVEVKADDTPAQGEAPSIMAVPAEPGAVPMPDTSSNGAGTPRIEAGRSIPQQQGDTPRIIPLTGGGDEDDDGQNSVRVPAPDPMPTASQ